MTKPKVYLVWLHDTVLEVCATHEAALRIVARAQGQIGGEWNRTGNRWYHATQQAQAMTRYTSRLEIEMRFVFTEEDRGGWGSP